MEDIHRLYLYVHRQLPALSVKIKCLSSFLQLYVIHRKYAA